MLNKNKQIKIAIKELSEQNKSVLTFYFTTAGKSIYQLVDEYEAEARIYDVDYPGAKEALEADQLQSKKPAIIFSMKEKTIDNTVWVAKPLSAKSLTEVAPEVHRLLASQKNSALANEQTTSTMESIHVDDLADSTETEIRAELTASEAVEASQLTKVEESIEPVVEVPELITEKTNLELDASSNTSLPNYSDEQAELKIDSIPELAIQNRVPDKSTALELVATPAFAAAGTVAMLGLSVDEEINNTVDLVDRTYSEEALMQDKSLTSNSVDDLGAVDVNEEPSLDFNLNDLETTEPELIENNKLESNDLGTVTSLDSFSESTFDSIDDTSSNSTIDLIDNTYNAEAAIAESTSLQDEFIAPDTQDILRETDDNSIAEPQLKEGITVEASNTSFDNTVDALEEITIGEQFDEHRIGLDSSASLEVEAQNEEIDGLLDSLTLDFEESAKDEIETSLLNETEIATKEDELFLDGLLDDIKQEDVSNVSAEETELNPLDEINDDLSFASTPNSGDEFIAQTEEVSVEMSAMDFLLDDANDSNLSNHSGLELENSDMLDFNLKEDLLLSPTLDRSIDSNTSLEETPLELDGLLEAAPRDEIVTEDIEETSFELDDLLEPVPTNEGEKNVSNESSAMEERAEVPKAVFDTPPIEDELPQVVEKTVTSNQAPTDSDLQSLLNEIREEADENGEVSIEDHSSASGNGYQKTNAEKRWIQLCGEHLDIDKQKEIAKISFNESDHLLQVLLNQIELVKNTEQVFRLKYNDLIIVIDHLKNKIFCNLLIEDAEFSEICSSELDQKEIKTHDLDYSEIRLYRNKMKQSTEKAHSIESFIWSTSLLTARGRLPKGTDLNKKVGLKVWPDLTRLELIPHAMNIAAVLSKHPSSLLETSKLLGIPQRYIFSFYHAAFSLGMIETNASKLKKSTFSFDKKASGKKTSERGLFSRLLKRLKS